MEHISPEEHIWDLTIFTKQMELKAEILMNKMTEHFENIMKTRSEESKMTIEKKNVYSPELKLKFMGEGEWVNEADYTEFEYRGYFAKVLRIIVQESTFQVEAYFGGYLCGYVKIPNDHPYYDKLNIDIECHGGITYNEIDENEHWIGFECGHLGDYVPTWQNFKNTFPAYLELGRKHPWMVKITNNPLFNPIYRNLDFCINECKCIIDQLIKCEVSK